MRVLIIFNHPAPYKVHVFNELAKYIDLTVLFERDKESNRPDDFYTANEYKFNHIILKDGYLGTENTYSSKVKRYIKKHHQEYDLILLNGYSHIAEYLSIFYMHRHHIKFGLLINGGMVRKENCLKRKFKTAIVSKANYFISPNTFSDDYLRHFGATNKIYRYQYGSLFENEILESSKIDKTALRKKYNLPLNEKIFVNASQFIERKNNIELLSVFSQRKEHLVLVGNGIEEKNYRKYIKDHNMNNVTIIPFKKKEELFEILKACDAFITLSFEDIFGHTTVEAFACGLPVISSNKVVSALQYVENGENGYIVDLNNQKEINDAIDNIKPEMSESAIKTAKEITFDKSAKSLLKAIKEVYGNE